MMYRIFKDRLIEIKTNQIIERSSDRKVLEDLKKNLDSGSGFEGYSPYFICKGYNT